MKITYEVNHNYDNFFYVVETVITYGARTSAYESLPDKEDSNTIYSGTPADCYAFVKLKDEKYLK